MKITVLVPLADELRRLRRALVSVAPEAIQSREIELIRIGPGEAKPRAFLDAHFQTKNESVAGHVIILAGCAGSLSAAADASTEALIIREVRDTDGTTIPCPYARVVDPAAAWRIVSQSAIVSSVREKAEVAKKHQAAIVDLESASFARALVAYPRQPWLILRGISDRHDETLPPEVAEFVDHAGKTRLLAVLGHIARNPGLIPTLMRLSKRTERAMRDIARTIARVHHTLLNDREAFTRVAAATEAAAAAPSTSALPANVLQSLRQSAGDADGSSTQPTLLIMGGSFDPFTLAHAAIAHAGCCALAARSTDAEGVPSQAAGLIFIPAARSPHKTDGPAATSSDRTRMIELTLKHDDRFANIPWGVWTDEVDRAAQNPGAPSYSVETAERLRALLDQNGLTNVRLRWIIGADQALALHRWHRPARFIELANPLVLLRPETDQHAGNVDWHAESQRLLSALRATGAWDERAMNAWAKRICPGPLLNISSSRVRELLGVLWHAERGENPQTQTSAERELSTLIHPAAAEFIRQGRLYSGL